MYTLVRLPSPSADTIADLADRRAAAYARAGVIADEAAFAEQQRQLLVRLFGPGGDGVLLGDVAGELGEVVIAQSGDTCELVATTVEDPAHAIGGLDGLRAWARRSGATRIRVNRLAGDPITQALRTPDESIVATNMRIALDRPSRADGRVNLSPFTDAEYEEWIGGAIAEYARERANAGAEDEAAALDVARASFAQLLPAGRSTPGQLLLSAYDRDERVGMVWIADRGGQAFIYDIIVSPEHRRKGYGASIMRASEDVAREMGATHLALNVFGHNDGARALYDGLGYEVTLENIVIPVVTTGAL
ncbi:GNAT family N-acetyltransferase [Microbacterium sp. GXS0129]|uniref:GNAT family N-acetyltransferase n=1 Tax=Microbacterium sp. GXS0129 TaxID=3377836 RepID=UPI00383B65E5